MKKELLYIHFRQECCINLKVDLSEMNPMEYSGVVFLSFCQDFEVIRVSLADWCELKKFISFEQNDLDRLRSTCSV